MRVTVQIFRTPEGRLEGTVATASGAATAFDSTLDLLRVLEGLDLEPPATDRTGHEDHDGGTR